MFDVAVIGCGPVGALAANLLGKAGLATLVIEREADPHPLPRAVHLDHEAMRLLQSAGLAERVAPIMRETDGHLHIGADRGIIRYLVAAGRPKPFGWANDYFFYQPELEALLREALAGYPNVDLRLGAELLGLAQDDEGCDLVLAGGRERARYVIGCDGARSFVRKAIGAELCDLGFEEPWLVVDAAVDGALRFPALAGLPDGIDLERLSVMMCDPRRPATIVPGPRNLRRWEFMLLPGETDQAMTQPDIVAGLLAPWLEGVPHRLLRAATYRFHGLVADRWQVGRVFLAGDAAHQTPPFFGQGMCHGMRDVANLAWKLAMVTDGSASPGILASYQPERDPHVRTVIEASIAAGRYICVLDAAEAATRDAAMRERMKAAAPATAADLIPPITNGLLAPGATGERFIQPTIGATLLDDVTGGGWRMFAQDAAAVEEALAALASIGQLGISVIDVSRIADGGTLAQWLLPRGRFALARPDFYLFGAADEAAGLVGSLRSQLSGGMAAQERAA